ncbi:transposase [Sphingobium nicotianae]|uniref:Transposase n=1 Tax=Sphingobium nicotianae TaxID=2782607 RepID=A0A9X1DF08_9SPHN|nr:transposase [Sphingobium nicotianae]MBT2188704.1 transposase [Sphingobium nicotianae]
MPLLLAHETDQVADVADLADACRSPAFDGGSTDGLLAVAPVLRALGNNREFLPALALDALKENCRTQLATNTYSAQVILLHPPEGNFFLRANIWPSAGEPCLRTSGAASFFYDFPHDHAFDFLTIGHLGPGYWSDYYEVEPESILGLPGEPVDLRFVERSQLSPDKMLLYRANRDIHDQLPPESLSVSINVMTLTEAQCARRQYHFDVEGGRIIRDMTATSAQLLLRLCVQFDSDELGGNGRDLAESFMRGHDDPRIRLAAWSAIDAATDDHEARLAHAETALRSTCPHLRRAGTRSLDLLRSGSIPSPARARIA